MDQNNQKKSAEPPTCLLACLFVCVFAHTAQSFELFALLVRSAALIHPHASLFIHSRARVNFMQFQSNVYHSLPGDEKSFAIKNDTKWQNCGMAARRSIWK